jgi:Zn-dependent protease
MNWSFRIARVLGIDVKVHVTFFLILVLGAVQWGLPYGTAGAIFGVLLMILLFACVILHELGHSVVAQYFGVPVREIVLLPVGGVAILSRNITKPIHELLVAAAGPAVNVVISVVLGIVALGSSLLNGGVDAWLLLLPGSNMAPSFTTLIQWLLGANVLLVLFNLIPAFPLDGGRMLRAVLAIWIGFPRATRIASAIGQLIAIGLGVVGVLTGNFVLVLVAVFIFFGAGQENNVGQAQTVLATLRVGDAYNKHALTLNIGDHVSKVVDYILTSYQPDFAVMQGTNLLGIVTREDVLRALASDTRDLYVTGIMRREFLKVNADKTLDEVSQIMAEQNQRIAAVYQAEQYLGLVSIEDISEALAVATFMQRQQQLRQQGEAKAEGS